MFVVTSTVEENKAALELALHHSHAVLLQGKVGSGKTALINHVAEALHARDTMLQINVDDTFDSKDLLGKLTATNTPGTFEWLPGPLTTAVQQGLWVLMEDIDLASFDVFSVLLPLLERKVLFIPEKNLTLEAHEGFKLIATQQLTHVVAGVGAGGNQTMTAALTRKSNAVPNLELWSTLIVQPPSQEEAIEIVQQQQPDVPPTVLKKVIAETAVAAGRPLSLRETLKWATRVGRRLHGFAASPQGSFLSTSTRELIFEEAYDCFCARLPQGKERDALVVAMSSACELDPAVGNSLALQRKPAVRTSPSTFEVGRVVLPVMRNIATELLDSTVFAPTRHSLALLERIAAAVDADEPVLLTGETGVGKTFVVQYLANQVGQTLVVHNLNQQTDCGDLMGGWKPQELSQQIRPKYDEFNALFRASFDAEKNAPFLAAVAQAALEGAWDVVLQQISKSAASYAMKPETSRTNALTSKWATLSTAASALLETVEQAKTTFTFKFEEGSLVRAWREGHWLLLDEVNLATTEVLERVSAVLGGSEKLFVAERGDTVAIPRHPRFRVFANMNPPTDVGKKELPPGLRSKFTELFVDDPFDLNDLVIVVNEYVGFLSPDPKVDEVAKFFIDCVKNAQTTLCDLDGESKPPHFSLRTLTRALSYVRSASALYGFHVALFDGLMLGFATPLQRKFHPVVQALIVKNIFGGKAPPAATLPKEPNDGQRHVPYEHMWMRVGSVAPYNDERFILTPSVVGHLRNLARAVYARRPVLLEGPTSSGKSSMVQYLAQLTGHKFVRINNHDSTEIQEYLGHYVSDENGLLRFMDGILVDAVRNGHWVVLDELNLAPTEVLEALNRLLDDNCEIFVPDTQELVKPHPELRIFATQNPAGVYGGRKPLSRAFRNRFLEVTVDDIPADEIVTILCQRYNLASSFAAKMVEVMKALQIRRQASHLFAGKHGYITPRDLFRWAERLPSTYQELSDHGFLLLAERCRKPEERQVVKDVMESVMKTVIDENALYHPSHWPVINGLYQQALANVNVDQFQIVWTTSMVRLFTVVGICLEHKEPVLLVGETGSSKTTICQLYAALLNVPLHMVNCHQHTEAADFLGSLRPSPPETRDEALFVWADGPLVKSMREGSMFVLDEISLAEDSVLERLNSVLEPSRGLTLAEKSSADHIIAAESFRMLATMNPGGDFGKKELSPALRNRFTEIYVRPSTEVSEIRSIVGRRLVPRLEKYAGIMSQVLCHVGLSRVQGSVQHMSIRDVISWVQFMNAANELCNDDVAFLLGLETVFLDGFTVGAGQSEQAAQLLRTECLNLAVTSAGVTTACLNTPVWELFSTMSEPVLPPERQNTFSFHAPTTRRNLSKLLRACVMPKAVLLEGSPGVGKTTIVEALGAALGKVVVRINLSDQTDVMDLFGTFLPTGAATANITGAEDGSATATGGGGGPAFAWSDGVLLRAAKDGHWVILDELNLASQAVLEGLNALLDHRATVYIPELCLEVRAHPSFRVFACQNPLGEGGGRKGLPRSFLNRFTRVKIEPFEYDDLLIIMQSLFPDFPASLSDCMVRFVCRLQNDVMVLRKYALRGNPWEFNLRDVLRWAKMMRSTTSDGGEWKPQEHLHGLFLARLRTVQDRQAALAAFNEVFGTQCTFADVSSPLVFSVSTRGEIVASSNGSTGTSRVTVGRLSSNNGDHRTTHGAALEGKVLMLPSQSRVVRSIIECATSNQFCLLVGTTGSGKSASLEVAAALCGAALKCFSITAGCDTVDLLGGFEQSEGEQGGFAWRDSLLLEAMIQGHWLVLDNANFCPASVLDRLNPLVEPNGFLSINEQGLVNGETRVVRPHSSFRLFATMDPRYGEVSRAMRNRAVEVFVEGLAAPSVEALAAVALKRRHDETEHLLDAVRLAAKFHQHFVLETFAADSSQPGGARLSDAVAAGAPNLFTLLKVAAMLPVGAQTSEDLCLGLRKILRQRYVCHRSGSWLMKKDKLLADVDTQVTVDSLSLFQQLQTTRGGERSTGVAGDELVASFTIQHLLDAFLLEGSSAQTALYSVKGFQSAMALRHAQHHQRRRRAHHAKENDDSAPQEASLYQEEKEDLEYIRAALLLLALDQTTDESDESGVGASAARIEAVTSSAGIIINASATNKRSAHGSHDGDEDVINKILEELSYISSNVSISNALLRAEVRFGASSDWTRMLEASPTMVISDSVSLNETSVHFHRTLHTFAMASRTTMTATVQRVLKFAGPLVKLLATTAVSKQTYVPLLTLLLLIRSSLLKAPVEEEAIDADNGGSTAEMLLDAVERFIDGIRLYTGIRLVSTKLPLLLRTMPRSLITSVDERSVATAARIAKTVFEANRPVAEKTMLPLWTSSSLSTELALVLELLAIAAQVNRGNSGAASVAAVDLQARVRDFMDKFHRRIPLLTEMEVSVWQLVAKSPRPLEIIAQLAPHLAVQTLTRHSSSSSALSTSTCCWVRDAAQAFRFTDTLKIRDLGGSDGPQATVARHLRYFFDKVFSQVDTASLTHRVAVEELAQLMTTFGVEVSSSQLPLSESAIAANDGLGTFAAEIFRVASSLGSLSAAQEGATTDSGPSSFSAIISSQIRQCVIRSRLLLPNSTLDPMFKWSTKAQTSQEELRRWSAVLRVFRDAAAMAQRRFDVPAAAVSSLRDREAAAASSAVRKFIPRPDPTGWRYAELVEKQQALCNTLLSPQRVHQLLANFGEESSAGESDSKRQRTEEQSSSASRSQRCESLAAWADLIAQHAECIVADFGGYEDIALPFAKELLMAAAAGHMLALFERQQHQQTGEDGSGGAMFSLTDALRLMRFPATTQIVLPPTNGTSHLQHRVSYLSACLAVVENYFVPPTVAGRLFDALRQLFALVEQLEMEENAAESMKVTYKEKAITIEGDDERRLRQLREMFPSYEKDFTEELHAGEEEEEANVLAGKLSERASRHAKVLFSGRNGERVVRIVECHRSYFSALASWSPNPALLFMARGSSSSGRSSAASSSFANSTRAFVCKFDALLPIIAKSLHGPTSGSGMLLPSLSLVEERLVVGGFAARNTLQEEEWNAQPKVDANQVVEKVEAGFNIFLDAEPTEAAQLSKPLAALIAQIRVLLAQYPDSPVLLRIILFGERISELPVRSTPLMKIMAGCELLLRECYEWERNASRDVSIISYISALSALILRWRRLELHCWPHIFAAKRQQFRSRASMHWFQLRDMTETLRRRHAEAAAAGEAATSETEMLAQCFEYLKNFLLGTCVGEFDYRLEIVKSFGLQLVSEGAPRFGNLLVHIVGYMGQFKPLVDAHAQKVTEEQEEDLRQFCKIMRWEDATYYAVRATAEKSHLKVARVLACLDDGLSLRVLALVQQDDQRFMEDAGMGVAAELALLSPINIDDKLTSRRKKKGSKIPLSREAAAAADAAAKAAEAKKKKQQKRLEKRNLKAAIARGETPVEDEDAIAPHQPRQPIDDLRDRWRSEICDAAVDFFMSSSDQIVERVQSLQQPKVPQSQKLRALKTLFDTLEESGLPHTVDESTRSWDSLFVDAKAVPISLALARGHIDNPLAAHLQTSERVLYKFARMLQEVRSARKTAHADLSDSQKSRAVGLCENLLLLAWDVLSCLASFGESLHITHTLSAAVASLVSVSPFSHQGDTSSACCTGVTSFATNSVQVSQEILHFTAQANWLISSKTFTTGSEQQLRTVVTALETAQAAAHDVASICGTLLSGGDVGPVAHVKQATQRLKDAASSLQQLELSIDSPSSSAAPPPIRAAASDIILKVREAAAFHTHDIATNQEGRHWAVLVEAASKSFDECCDAAEVLTAPRTDEGELHPAVFASFRQALQVIGGSYAAAEAKLRQALADHKSSRTFDTLEAAQHISNIIVQMRQRLEGLMANFADILRSSSYLGFVLSRLFCVLFKKGFCKSEDDNDEENEGGDGEGEQEQKDGTGMDDGQGDKDVTNEIENEDQLMNMKDKEEQQKPEPEDEGSDASDEKDNAADVETDFKADKQKRDREDDEENEDDEDEDESDKEMGDVDKEEQMERKKSRKDKREEAMEHDEGGEAEEVPEDDLDQHEKDDEMGEDDELDETHDAGNKEEEIKKKKKEDDDENKDGAAETELVGDNMRHDASDDDDGDEDENGQEKSGSDDERAESEDDSDAEDEADKGADKDVDSNEGEGSKEDGELDPNQDEQESIDQDGSDDGDDLRENDNVPDENVFEGGEQDDNIGEEDTKNKDRKPQQQKAEQDIAGAEEEQAGQEQQEDDAGRSWKKQEQNNASNRQDKSKKDAPSKANPHAAIKEALQRHQQRMQRLDVAKSVKLKQDDRKGDDKEDKDKRSKPEKDDDNIPAPEVDEFEFDEKGEQRGLAATDEAPAPTANEDDDNEEGGSHDDDDDAASKEEDDENDEGARKLRKKPHDVDMESTDEKDDEDKPENDKQKKSKRKAVKTGKKSDVSSSDSEDDEADAAETDAADVDPNDRLARGRRQWYAQEAAVQGLAQQLCEQLRLILSPTVADKLQGDYKTGKRINIKKIIPYIASQYKKDRIWLRRTKPNKRTYQILVALDDSLSMQCNNVASLQAVALLSKAMQQLEVGEFGIISFGKEAKVVHPLSEPFTLESGPRVFSELSFEQKSTNMKAFLQTTLDYMDAERSRSNSSTRSTTEQLLQILFVISDGQITEDREELRRLVARAKENKQVVVLIILDNKSSGPDASSPIGADNEASAGLAAAAASPQPPLRAPGGKISAAEKLRQLKAEREARLQRVERNSVVDMQIVEFKGNKVLKTAYLENFPFPFYLIVKNLASLPEVLADAMRQWFELLNNA